jgi:hypothetical protein
MVVHFKVVMNEEVSKVRKEETVGIFLSRRNVLHCIEIVVTSRGFFTLHNTEIVIRI